MKSLRNMFLVSALSLIGSFQVVNANEMSHGRHGRECCHCRVCHCHSHHCHHDCCRH